MNKPTHQKIYTIYETDLRDLSNTKSSAILHVFNAKRQLNYGNGHSVCFTPCHHQRRPILELSTNAGLVTKLL